MSVALSVIVPVLNGERYIATTIEKIANYLARSTGHAEIVVVDDGSNDATLARAEQALSRLSGMIDFTLLENRLNRGKGYSVRRGMLAATGARRVFLDADLAYAAENIDAIVAALDAGADLAIASRVRVGSRYLMAPDFFRHIYARHVIGRLFNLMARWVVLDDIRDTQAGLKGMTQEAAELLLPLLTLERFSFDVELLFLAQRHGMRIDEVAVTFEYTSEPSNLELGRDGLKMLADLARIRVRAARGVYDREPGEAFEPEAPTRVSSDSATSR